MNEGRCAFKRLYEVRLDRVLQKSSHRALRLQISGCDRFAVNIVGDNDAGQSFLEVNDVIGEAENCHDLGSDRDIETVFTRNTVCLSAETIDDETKLSVVHIDTAFPDDTADVDASGVALLDMVVKHRG